MALITRWLIPLCLWAAALFGCLQLHTLELGHSICGAWGCGPPSAALLAMHSFWLLVLVPAGAVATYGWPHLAWQRIGRWIVYVALAIVTAITIYDYFTFQHDPFRPVYVWQRCLFRLATLHDWPIIQLGLTGAVVGWLGRQRGDWELESEAPSSEELPTFPGDT